MKATYLKFCYENKIFGFFKSKIWGIFLMKIIFLEFFMNVKCLDFYERKIL